ncbi:hypothetical protein HOP50_02g19680 [Chloropicon primus]|uniref:Uncharacterized protein n=1 Tax=Chloropicon primus TaxID=1764295 RepID=A0A5B8MJD0_9CHLO|nr:hypothetical protein A3770_02p19700 [Chloropicon primus]UPQ98662.1 hypothetical protein HOP50_02g19680 [Chloropicon primus]|eukprot:QDZ19452.1 hypothetical protein A3770_02p19700 [Chloropicon primus]
MSMESQSTGGGVRYTLNHTGGSRIERNTGGFTKKKRNYDYEIDKLRKDNQLLKESLKEKENKIQELRNALDEITRMSASELAAKERSLVKKDRAHLQLKRQLDSAKAEHVRTKEASQGKLELLQRERKEMVRALHSIASQCTKARTLVEPVYGREEVFPKKVEPWLSLTYDSDYVPSPKRTGRSTLGSTGGRHAHRPGLSSKALPFQGAGVPLVAELLSLVEQTCTKYAEQSKAVAGYKSSVRELKQELKEAREESGDLSEMVDIVVDEVREGSVQRDLDGLPPEPETSGCSNQVKLKLVHKQLKAFNALDAEVSEKCRTFETQALELEFYAKLHGKLVKQAVYDSLNATGNGLELSPNKSPRKGSEKQQ